MTRNDMNPRVGEPTRTHEITADEANAAGKTLARAFATDPMWEFLTEHRFARFESLSVAFFAAEVRNHLRHVGSMVTDDVRSVALWGPPGNWKTTYRDIVRLFPSSLHLFGSNVIRALVTLDAVDRLHPTEPHWYLGFLGTDPDFQGRGYGSAVLRPVLERCDLEGLPAYLESSKEQNVPFYERHGFEVTGTIDLAKGAGPRVWLMWREPTAPDV